MWEIFGKNRSFHFCKRAGKFYTRWPRAYHNNIHQFLPFLLCCKHQFFKLGKDRVTDVNGLLGILHRHGILF